MVIRASPVRSVGKRIIFRGLQHVVLWRMVSSLKLVVQMCCDIDKPE